ncbi:Nn.00g009660.m01.CDS01 [Neocucurbitaria sp. VM-36]
MIRETAQQWSEAATYVASSFLEYDDEEVGFDTSVVAESGPPAEFFSYELSLSLFSKRIGLLSFEFAEQLTSATYEIVYTSNLTKPKEHDSFLQALKDDLSSEPWRVRDDGFPSSTATVPQSTGDPEVLKVAGRWLSQCLDNHSSCEHDDFSPDKPWYPKRLLDVSAPSGQPRLVITRKEEPKERYATLSHCWGPKPICCLTADNIEDYEGVIPREELTNTFRDAINATRMLQIRYLWIDSLCIMQAGPGSKEDWQEHAVAMRLVYTNSLVNIAAARAEEGADGAFATREETFLRPCHIRWTWPSNFHEYAAESFWTIRQSHHHSAMGTRMLPLYTRGWVVQERFLAPRVLHFAEDRIMWECNEIPLAEESFPDGFQDSCPHYEAIVQWPFNLSKTPTQAQSGASQSTVDTSHTLWQDMINEYTRCDLSFPDKDIFVALAGIAERFGQLYNHQYCAGLFRQHLPFDLLWQNKGERADTFRAPSWSWANIDGPVEMRAFSECPFCDQCCDPIANVKDVRIALVDLNNTYGQVKYAELTLEGYLFPCSIEPATQAGTGLRQKFAIHTNLNKDNKLSLGAVRKDSTSVIWGEADIDDEEQALRGSTIDSNSTIWALPVIEVKPTPGASPFKHRGLLLERKPDGKYVRSGIYQLRNHLIGKLIEQGHHTPQDVCFI